MAGNKYSGSRQRKSPYLKKQNRDYTNDKNYQIWRKAVFVRDGYKCKNCGQGSNTIHAHHIVKWADSPALRYVVDNGVTLCKECHKKITGNEVGWQAWCKGLINKSGFMDVKQKLWKMKQKEKQKEEQDGDLPEEV